jgi:hypothetical protein
VREAPKLGPSCAYRTQCSPRHTVTKSADGPKRRTRLVYSRAPSRLCQPRSTTASARRASCSRRSCGGSSPRSSGRVALQLIPKEAEKPCQKLSSAESPASPSSQLLSQFGLRSSKVGTRCDDFVRDESPPWAIEAGPQRLVGLGDELEEVEEPEDEQWPRRGCLARLEPHPGAQAVLAALALLSGKRKQNAAFALAELLSRRGLERPREALAVWAREA